MVINTLHILNCPETRSHNILTIEIFCQFCIMKHNGKVSYLHYEYKEGREGGGGYTVKDGPCAIN